MIWIYKDRRKKEIVCTQKYTLSIENGIMGVTKMHKCYINNQVVGNFGDSASKQICEIDSPFDSNSFGKRK